MDEKNSLKSRMEVNFLDHKSSKTEEILKEQLTAFREFNNGPQIAFVPSDRIDDFIKGYTEYYNDFLNLSAKEKKEAKLRAQKEGFFGTETVHHNFTEISETGLVFLNHKSGVEIALGVNCAFPLPNNPFFDIERSEDDIMFLLISDEFSKELSMFCIENCKDNLPFFTDGLGKIYLKDIDFLLRFWKKDNYFLTCPFF